MPRLSNARDRLIAAAQDEIRRKGYSATRIEDICSVAGVTKGSFFHHFAGKNDVGQAALEAWSSRNEVFFAKAPYHQPEDALDRLLAYIDFRIGMIDGAVHQFSCLAGTLTQEVFETNAALATLAAADMDTHNGRMAALVREAAASRGRDIDADAIALFMQAATQGAFIAAKAGGADAARAVLSELRHYVELLFASDAKVHAQ